MNDFDIYGLAYDKLLALMLSRSKEARMLLEKILSCDVFILDEFTTAIIRDIQTIALLETDRNDNVRKMSDFVEKLEKETATLETPTDTMRELLWAFVKEFLYQFENIVKNGEHNNECFKGLCRSDVSSAKSIN